MIPSWELTYYPYQGIFEDEFPFPQVGYVISLEGTVDRNQKSGVKTSWYGKSTPIIYDGFLAPSQVVVWDVWTINSNDTAILQEYLKNKNLDDIQFVVMIIHQNNSTGSICTLQGVRLIYCTI